MPHEDAALLIVEDDPDALLLLKRALIQAGMADPVRVAVDGEEAVSYLSGRGIFADRSTHPRLRRIPVVIVTTSGEERDRRRALELGAREYIIKPIDPAGLLYLARKLRRYTGMYSSRIRAMVDQDQEVPPLKL